MLTYFATKLKLVQFRPLFQRQKCLCIGRYFSSEEPTKSSGSNYEPSFTSEEQRYILETLNEADVQQLNRYSLPKNRVKKLHDWRKKHGKFNSLIDVLDVDGLGVKTLDKLCKNILNGETENVEVEVKEKSVKPRGQFLTPSMSLYHAKELSSSLGIHLYATGISWARIERENNFLSNWNFFEFNLGTKKLSPSDALQLVLEVSKEIPACEVYIFEAPISVTPTAQQSPISVAAYVQRIQLLSMLITLLSTSQKHNPNYNQIKEQNEEDSDHIKDIFDFSSEPKVFFLRHRLSARLFRTLIGTEKVSTATTVSNILNNYSTEKINYSPISVAEDLQCMYNKQIPVTKEVLGQALLLTMAFMDVCVYQNRNSLKIVSTNSR